MIYSVLPDFTERFDATVEEISRALSATPLGATLGGLLGFLIDRFYGRIDLLLGLMIAVCGVSAILKPRIPILGVLAGLNFVDGLLWSLVNGGTTRG